MQFDALNRREFWIENFTSGISAYTLLVAADYKIFFF